MTEQRAIGSQTDCILFAAFFVCGEKVKTGFIWTQKDLYHHYGHQRENLIPILNEVLSVHVENMMEMIICIGTAGGTSRF